MPIRCAECGGEWTAINPSESRCPHCGAVDSGEVEVEIGPEAERSTGGSVIYRHEARVEEEFEFAAGDERTIEAVSGHVERCIGPVESVWHEIVSDLVHVDLHWVKPAPDRPHHTLVTSGMSDRPMAAPRGAEDWSHAELCLALPPDWPLDQQSLTDEAWYWPLRWLKILARFPHEFRTWLGWGHTIPNGDPPEPFAPGVRFNGWMLMQPLLVDEAFHRLEIDGRTVWFYAIVPLHPEEMTFKLQSGADELVDRFLRHGVTELIDRGRPTVCPSSNKWW